MAPVSDEGPASIRSLKALRGAEEGCTRCPLFRNATQAVPGTGAARAAIMLVGEQPGDQEDRQGKPFVGPAGRVLDEALDAAGIARRDCFVTNAVKHFKFEPRGKRRLHKRPGAYEVDRCHLWLETEIRLVKPRLIVALGATAVRGLCGKPLAIGKIRGHVIALPDQHRMLATVHPSYILRIRDDGDRHAQFQAFVGDLKVGVRSLNRTA